MQLERHGWDIHIVWTGTDGAAVTEVLSRSRATPHGDGKRPHGDGKRPHGDGKTPYGYDKAPHGDNMTLYGDDKRLPREHQVVGRGGVGQGRRGGRI
jgi:hypothetical protein